MTVLECECCVEIVEHKDDWKVHHLHTNLIIICKLLQMGRVNKIQTQFHRAAFKQKYTTY